MSYEEFLNEWTGSADYIECKTSGSTGVPQKIKLSKKFIKESAIRTIKFFGLDKNSHLYSCISPEYIGGKMMAVRAQMLECPLSYETPSNKPLKAYTGPSIDLLAVVPSQMDYILDNLKSMPSIKNIIVGGGPVSKNLQKRIVHSGLNAFETYGMTETASHIALRKIDHKNCYFKPLEGINVESDNEKRLVINIDKNAENSNFFKFRTNDIAKIYSDGSFKLLGRYDNVIISGGIKINPEQVEEILEEIFELPVLITSIPDNKWGEKIIMIIDDSTRGISDNYILKVCRDNLNRFSIPKEIFHMPLPKTSNGKKSRIKPFDLKN